MWYFRRILVPSSSIGQIARSAGKECSVGVLRLLGVFRLFRWLNRHRLIILTYHSVLPSTSGIDSGEARNVVAEEMFAWQMRYLAKHFRCVRLEDAVKLLEGDRLLPPNSVVVTFDDGFRNNLRYALPILQRYAIPATVFVTTGHIGRGMQLLWTERVGRLLRSAATPQSVAVSVDSQALTLSFATSAERDAASRDLLRWLKSMPAGMRDDAIGELERQLEVVRKNDSDTGEPDAERYMFMTWNEVRELARGGVTIGSHTVDHPIMSSLDAERRRFEVVESKREIENALWGPCTLFSYPNGTADDFGDCDKANLRQAGYVAAVSQIAGMNDGETDRFALRRLNIGHGHGPNVFVAQVCGFWPWMRSLAGARRTSRVGRPEAQGESQVESRVST
jgi:peptidoglycan/xylan/chitin deacetylase (PgdA/CDA1 family)